MAQIPYVPPVPRVRWSRDAQLAAFRAGHAAHGHWPTAAECKRAPALPSLSTVLAEFRSLANARRLAQEAEGATGR
jgi:hypothetical protein